LNDFLTALGNFDTQLYLAIAEQRNIVTSVIAVAFTYLNWNGFFWWVLAFLLLRSRGVNRRGIAATATVVYGTGASWSAQATNPGNSVTAGTPVEHYAFTNHAQAAVVAAALEVELAELDPKDAAEYRASYGLTESGLAVVARAVWQAGGLITYFTAGEPEARAWPCEDGAPAPIAAGVIHTDFIKKFIRAEVTSVDELVEAGSMEALRSAGKLRVEGREYRVKDGDVIFFRIGG